MSTLGVVCARGPVIELCGRELQIKGRTLGDYAEVCAQIEWIRGSIIEKLRQMSPSIQTNFREKFFTDMLRTVRHKHIDVTGGDMCRWIRTLDGRVFAFWQAVRDSGVTLQWCRDAYCEQSIEWDRKIQWAIDMASGDGEEESLWSLLDVKETSDDAYERPFVRTIGILSREPFGYSPAQISGLTFGQVGLILKDPQKGRYDDVADEQSAKKLIGDNVYLTRKALLKPYEKAYSRFARNIANGRHILSLNEDRETGEK